MSARDIAWALEQAEAVERGAPVTNSRDLIRDMAERMATERRDKQRRATVSVFSRAPVVRVPAAPLPPRPPAPVAGRVKPRRGWMGRNSWTLKILRALKGQAAPASVGNLYERLPGIKYHSLCAFLVTFVKRQYASRIGERPNLRFALGAKGAQYLETFHPSPD